MIHNVATLASVPFIIENGPEAFKAIGKPGSYGTELYGMCGHVNKPGVYEYPMGMSLRKLIYEVAGGIRGNKKLKAVIPGGLSAPILKADEIDVEMDFESLIAAGSILGTGGIIVLDEDVSIPFVAQKTAKFFSHESCGKCTPCREGTNVIKFLIDRITAGKGGLNDIEHVLRLCRYIRGSTLCALGDAAAMSIGTMVKKFRSEFEKLVKQ
jgi:NADH-quinone oxidoreductase subunit F